MNSNSSSEHGAKRWWLSVAISCSFLTTLIWVSLAIPSAAQRIQVVDWRWHDTMADLEWVPLTIAAAFLSAIGGNWVTVPVRFLVAIWLWNRKKFTGLLIWVLAVVPAQMITWFSKILYARLRPDDRLLETTTASFPSGHSTNAAVMGLALVFIFVPPGHRRTWWLAIGFCYALLMAWSRTYLRVHWLSDVVGGLLLGTSCALCAVLLARCLKRTLIR